MRIGIIGAGHIGQAVAGLAKRAGYDVMISNSRGPETLTDIAATLEVKTGSVEEAIRFGDMLVVSIPLKNYPSLPDVGPDKVVIDTGNYYPTRDGQIAELDQFKTTTSEMLTRKWPSARVVKAFNNINWVPLGKGDVASINGDIRALPIAGDDADAKRRVRDMIEAFGFDVVDAGRLADGWRFENGKPAYGPALGARDLGVALGAAERGVTVEPGTWRPEPGHSQAASITP